MWSHLWLDFPPDRLHVQIRRTAVRFALLMGILLGTGQLLRAQEAGRIVGNVVNAAAGSAVGQAQVFIEGTGLGTLSRSDGRFLLVNVPPGTHELQVQLVGYASATETVTVEAGATTSVSFALREQAISLDEVVVTGLPTQARRREVGTALEGIDVAEVDVQPIENMQSLLQGSSPGVQVLSNQGQVGASGSIQLRGATSVTQGNEPLVYVDGIRLSTQRTPAGAAFDGRNTRVSGFTWDDINLQDVARIEIIKGAAATALYGTEASGGVIQIFTKRGTEGAPQWSFSATGGANFWPEPSSVIQQHPTNLDIDRVKRTGPVMEFNGSVRGGNEDLAYFISASGSDAQGIVDTQWSNHWTAAANFDVNLFEGFTLRINNNYTHRLTREVADGNNRYGYMLNVLRVGKGYKFGSRDQSWVLEQEYLKETDTFLSGLNATYVTDEFQHDLRLGLHHAEVLSTGLQPFGWHLNPQGTISTGEWTNRLLTLEYSSTWSRDITDGILSTLAVGGQIYDERNREVTANGQEFPGPGNHTVSSASRTTSAESKIQEINAGFFVQEQLGIGNRLFLIGALRFDGSSTFGDDYGFQTYPKVSGSYVISDEGFWSMDWWNSLRLRAAVGQAGKAPGAFDAARTWQPIAAKEGEPGVSPGNVGNPNLGPERTTEVEFGLDSDMFGGRLNTSVTYYRANTTDALFAVQPIPSQGFLSSQLRNVGELTSSGIELSADAILVDNRSLSWQVGADLSTTNSRVVDMGGAAPFSISRLAEVREGYAAPSVFGRKVTNPDELADPVFENDAFLGRVFPNKTLALRSSMSLGPLSLSGVGEMVTGGHNTFSVGWLNTIREAWPGCTEAQNAAVETLTARVRARCLRDFTGADQFVESADFFKLRNLTASLRLPDGLLPQQVSTATLAVTGINLVKITDYPGLDPESHQGGGDSSYREDYYTVPPRRALKARLSVTF